MKYLIHYKDQDGQTKELIKEFESNNDFDTWETEQKTSGIDVTEITNILDSVHFNGELDDGELTMLIKNTINDISHVSEIIRSDDITSVDVFSENDRFIYTIEQKDNILTILKKSVGVDKTPHYFLRSHILMFMEMFRGKYLFAE